LTVPPTTLLFEAKEALVLAAAVSLPVIAVAALVGVVVAALQAATQVQDVTLAHLPRLVAVALALALLGPWMAREVGTFAERMLVLAAQADR
jgi:flagellar biosynthesis protein FliQ